MKIPDVADQFNGVFEDESVKHIHTRELPHNVDNVYFFSSSSKFENLKGSYSVDGIVLMHCPLILSHITYILKLFFESGFQ